MVLKKTCDCCARRKLKCDGKFPVCSRCKNDSANKRKRFCSPCTYSCHKRATHKNGQSSVANISALAPTTNDKIDLKSRSEKFLKADHTCAFALLDLKTRQEARLPNGEITDVLSSQQDFLANLPRIEHSIAEIGLVGTKIDRFLSSFSTRISQAAPAFVNFSMLQQAVLTFPSDFLSSLDACILSEKDVFRSVVERLQCIYNPACLSYFLIAIRLGSLQSGDFQPENQKTYYEAIDLLFRPCCAEETSEVILTHLLLALFSKATSQKSAFIKHSGFAKVLLSTLHSRGMSMDEGLNRIGAFIIDGASVPLFSIIGIEHKLLQLLPAPLKICQEDFLNKFPLLVAFIDSIPHIQASDEDDSESERVLLGVARGNLSISLPLMTVRYFQTILTVGGLSNVQIEQALIEMVQFMYFVVERSLLSVETLPLIIRGYVLQIDCFKFLVQRDCTSAKFLLSSILDGIDFWALKAGYFQFGDCMIHQIHFLIAAAAILRMESEYYSLSQKLGLVFSLLGHPFPLPSSLSGLGNNSHSLCGCPEKSYACDVSILIEALGAFCIVNKENA